MTTLPERLQDFADDYPVTCDLDRKAVALLREAALALQPSVGGEVVEPAAWKLKYPLAVPTIVAIRAPEYVDSLARAEQLSAACLRDFGEAATYSPLYLASPAQADGFVLDAEKLTAWLDEQLRDAESSWIDTLQELWEDGHDVPSSTEYPALWIAERLPGYLAASTPPSAPRAGDTAQDSGQG